MTVQAGARAARNNLRRPPTGTIGIDLYWLPLGAGGHFVRFNGRVYERLHALFDHRRPLDLYHSALEVTVPEGRFVIENSWPIPRATGASRGVTVEGPVGSRHLGRFRAFRYEVRRWYEGSIADAEEAVESPRRLSDDEAQARRLLGLTAHVPAFVWGRDEAGTGEMWNSNSVISWLLAKSGLPASEIHPPRGRCWRMTIWYLGQSKSSSVSHDGSGSFPSSG